MRLTDLFIHPVKSCAAQRVDEIELAPWGPVGDRRWAVTDRRGRLVTARTVPSLLSIAARSDGDRITLTEPDGSSVVVECLDPGATVQVNVSRMSEAVDAGDDAADLLRRVCGRDLRLIWQPDPTERSVNPANGGLPGETLSLADAGPLLLTSSASLRRLQEWVGPRSVIAMGRFRPNIVIDGRVPFDEDDWASVRIGESDFRVQQTCDRCVMTTIDPATLERSEEPLATLRRHRARGSDVFFGIRLVPVSGSHIAVDDEVVPVHR